MSSRPKTKFNRDNYYPTNVEVRHATDASLNASCSITRLARDSELLYNKRRWVAQSPDHYSYEYQYGCHEGCVPVAYRVAIKSGEVVSVKNLGDNPLGATDPVRIEDMFDKIDSMAPQEVFDFADVQFDEEFLVPLKITYTGERFIRDDDIWEEISAIEVIE